MPVAAEARPKSFTFSFRYSHSHGPEECVRRSLETLARYGLSVTGQTEVVESNVSREQLFDWRTNYLSRHPEYTLDDLVPLTDERIALITKPVQMTVLQLSSPDGELSGRLRFCERNEYAMGWDGYYEQEELEFLGGCLWIEGANTRTRVDMRVDLCAAFGLHTTRERCLRSEV